jgi:hypothetical protein
MRNFFGGRPEAPDDGYKNLPYDRDSANEFLVDAGLIVCDRDDRGCPIPKTARLTLVPSGEGYDIRMPLECLIKLLHRVADAEGKPR